MKLSLPLLTLPILASSCLLPEERDGLPRAKVLDRRQSSNNGIPIATGDRFSGGTIAPRGLGTQTVTLNNLLNVNEIASGLKGLASVYGISTFTTPYKTYNGATISGGKAGGNGTCNSAYRVYLNAAIHARERGGSDGLLYFIGDLLYASKNAIGLKYGSKTYTAAQVKTALSTGIVFVPLSNPDGVAYDQSSNSCWRKNRNPKSSTGSASSVGVDLNRNFDFLWDFTKLFASSARGSVASTSPTSETFHGTSAFSEPEAQSIKWVMDTFSKVRWFVDLHSYAGDVLYSWGSDEDQSKFPTQNFLNASYNSVRGVLTDTPGSGNGYGEYVPPAENTDNIEAATRMGAAMSAATKRTYSVMPAAELYPTSGASDDYSYSRHFADPSKNLIHGYTVEFGFGNTAASCPFYPTQAQHNQNIQEIGAGFMELLLAGADIGLGDAVAC
ncbi:related to carboxypeptidase A [Rhynchosporium agropyri]|uniref:Related to carboxypeptidase A n=1 Tax=Rhynchosporium agropyri TaxID=914238 RepID=A0A1E1JRW3_9HELO|nr:related to carboxypeptidase A [Rhynchosporium agropyri]